MFTPPSAHRDKEKMEKIVKSLGLKLAARDLRHNDSKIHLQAICNQWLPISKAVLCILANLKISFQFPHKSFSVIDNVCINIASVYSAFNLQYDVSFSHTAQNIRNNRFLLYPFITPRSSKMIADKMHCLGEYTPIKFRNTTTLTVQTTSHIISISIQRLHCLVYRAEFNHPYTLLFFSALKKSKNVYDFGGSNIITNN